MASKVARNGEKYQNTREAKGKARVASDEDHHSRGEDHSSPWRAMNLGSNMMHFLHENHHLTRCDHTSTNAPDPIRTPQLSVLGRPRVVLGWVTSWEVLVLHLFLPKFPVLFVN
ncbi:hypothetical protein MTR_2g059810 [Medicago truncatula]|uniref:Uncharacterized protein n=1 Tax=Medicago truncatula TaxID=3880 RepID=A0A072V8U0_MEDTR|nr:hypothetical protein MTR_2g059810 [Medicago truncatula]